jgi:hypothetical protein
VTPPAARIEGWDLRAYADDAADQTRIDEVTADRRRFSQITRSRRVRDCANGEQSVERCGRTVVAPAR